MNDVRMFKQGSIAMTDFGEGQGIASKARLIGPDSSQTMGAYFCTFDGRSVEWTVQYDELIVCLKGLFRLRTAEGIYELEPGDVLWVGNGTALHYEGESALVFMAISPVDWRSRVAR